MLMQVSSTKLSEPQQINKKRRRSKRGRGVCLEAGFQWEEREGLKGEQQGLSEMPVISINQDGGGHQLPSQLSWLGSLSYIMVTWIQALGYQYQDSVEDWYPGQEKARLSNIFYCYTQNAAKTDKLFSYLKIFI